jgi:signal peptidase I
MNRRKPGAAGEIARFALIVIAVFAGRSSLADHYYVPSGSMEYTLLAGDRVVVSKLAYGLRVPFTNIEIANGAPVGRGDVVIFDSPRDGTRLIKRVVGIGGDTVSITDGKLSVNGRSLAGPAESEEVFGDVVVALNLRDGGGPGITNLAIPEGMVLAVGDHRGRSLDGRTFGLVPAAAVYGKALGVYRRRDEGFVWRPL